MPTISVTDRSGTLSILQVAGDITLMEALRDNGYHDILALCGGNCACATCHVYVEPNHPGLPAMGPDENALLDAAEHRTSASRLSCQIQITDVLEGLRLTIAPGSD